MSLDTTDPLTVEAVVRAGVNQALLDVRTVHPAKVRAVRDNGSVDVDLMIHSVFADGTDLALPSVTQLPVLFQGNSQFALSFPVAVGDEGLALFAERDISIFLSSGKTGRPRALRRHSLSDGLFLPTPISQPKRLETRPNTLLLSNNGTSIEITDGKVKITGDVEISGKATVEDDIESLSGDVFATSQIPGALPPRIALTEHPHGYVDDGNSATTQPPNVP